MGRIRDRDPRAGDRGWWFRRTHTGRALESLVPRPDGFVSSPTDSGAPGLDFETWEITNPRGHGTSPLVPLVPNSLRSLFPVPGSLLPASGKLPACASTWFRDPLGERGFRLRWS